MCAGYHICVKVKRFPMTYAHMYMLEFTCVTSWRIHRCILITRVPPEELGNRKEEDVPFSAFLLASAKVLWE